jgi:hypothetical protein
MTTQDSTFRLIKTEVMPLTLDLAKRFRGMQGSPTERALNQSRVEHLREKAVEGRLIPFMWATATLDGVEYRMNGQHSSEMLCTLDGMFPPSGTVVMSRFEVPDKNALAQLFRQWDDRKSGRSTADVAGAYQGLVEALNDVPRKIGKEAIDGVAWYTANVEGLPTARGDDRYGLFNDPGLHPFIKWIADLFSSKTPELAKPSVIAAIYGTFTKNSDEAKAFWNEVARMGDQYNDSAASTVLDAWLRQNHEDHNPDVKPANLYQGCIFAWNAHRQGKTLASIKYDARKALNKISE